MFQGMGVTGIEEDRVVELRAQAGDPTATISRTPMKSRSPSEVPISTGTFNARAAPVTAFNATKIGHIEVADRDPLTLGIAQCLVECYHARST
jgi:hypothetical protein